jgi:hypothetical protein
MMALCSGKVTGIGCAGVLVVTQTVISNIYTFIINLVTCSASDHTAIYEWRTGTQRHAIAGTDITELCTVTEQSVVTVSVRGASGLNVYRNTEYKQYSTQHTNQ